MPEMALKNFNLLSVGHHHLDLEERLVSRKKNQEVKGSWSVVDLSPADLCQATREAARDEKAWLGGWRLILRVVQRHRDDVEERR